MLVLISQIRGLETRVPRRQAEMANEPVTEAEVRAIIAKWGELHDQQAGTLGLHPVHRPRTAFYMEFGGKRWEGYAGFENPISW